MGQKNTTERTFPPAQNTRRRLQIPSKSEKDAESSAALLLFPAIARTQNTSINKTSFSDASALSAFNSLFESTSSAVQNTMSLSPRRQKPNAMSGESSSSRVDKSGSPRRNPFSRPSGRRNAGGLSIAALGYGSPPPAALHPNGPPFETLHTTLYRHLALANTTRLTPHIYPNLTIAIIFNSLKRELLDALTILNLDMMCHICTRGRDHWKHISGNMKDCKVVLETEVESLESWNWMDEKVLKRIADDVFGLKHEYVYSCTHSSCLSYGWDGKTPKSPTTGDREAQGVRADLPPFGQGSRRDSYSKGSMRR